MSHHIIETQNLHYTYPDGTLGIKDISFRITHGESVAMVGANGAGKSTLWGLSADKKKFKSR
jgi:cobalt/nickel transport system ATP-binding protein